MGLFNFETGQLLHTIFFNAGRVVTTTFSPDGATLLIAWVDGVVHLYDTTTFELRREFFVQAFLDAAAYSPDGQFILTGESWPLFRATLWDATTIEPLRIFEGHQWNVSALAFSRDGSRIATAGELVREWSIADLAARLQTRRLDDQLELRWSLGQLESAPSLDGPWRPVENATSPWAVPVSDGTSFYRVRTE